MPLLNNNIVSKTKKWFKYQFAASFLFFFLLFNHPKHAKCQNTIPLVYELIAGNVSLKDNRTGMPDIFTIFNNEPFEVFVGLLWEDLNNTMNSSKTLYWVTSVDDNNVANGTYMLNSSRMLPSIICAGLAHVSSSGSHTIAVTLTLDDTHIKPTRSYQSYYPGVSIIPVVLVLLIVSVFRAGTTTIALGAGVYAGAWIITGSWKQGFKQTFTVYIVEVLSEKEHIYTFLLLCCFSGVAALLQKSGGVDAFVSIVLRHVKTQSKGQLIAFVSGILCVFDDFLSVILVGSLFRPITNALCVSCEKLAFLINVTAEPITVLIPCSSWVVVISGLMQVQLDSIIAMNNGTAPNELPRDGLSLYLQTIQYLYYNFYILFLALLLIGQSKDYSHMLIAERKAYVYGYTNGGTGSCEDSISTRSSESSKPDRVTPLLLYNLAIPLIAIICLLIYKFIDGGNDGSGSQSLYEMFTSGNHVEAIIEVIAGVLFCMFPFYILQFYQGGKLVLPTPSLLRKVYDSYRLPSAEDEDVDLPKQLMTPSEFKNNFSHGIRGIIDTFVIFAFAWSLGRINVDIGTPRLFTMWAVNWKVHSLPTISYLVSTLMALTTGSAVLTISVMTQFITTTIWFACEDGNLNMFYATMAGILSGAVSGVNMSPISDTSILSSFASQCQHQSHVWTQIPYVGTAILFAVICGTLPIGAGFNNIAVILIGLVAITIFVYCIGVKVQDKSGRLDIFTEIILMCKGSTSLNQLKYDSALVEIDEH